mmetsp:Transcript_56716/g.66292  ORF Transcript_56716/g.66292 Transcript_56716/m.66292 type:complete len:105 (+) Transcript_56716:1218-1532(+)
MRLKRKCDWKGAHIQHTPTYGNSQKLLESLACSIFGQLETRTTNVMRRHSTCIISEYFINSLLRCSNHQVSKIPRSKTSFSNEKVQKDWKTHIVSRITNTVALY